MKRFLILALVIAVMMLVGASVFAADGDLVVNGNIGVGTTTPAAKMDVNGEVKLGNSGLACSSSSAGALRYNSTSSKIEYCNGTAWMAVSGGPTWQMIWSTDVAANTSNVTATDLNGDVDQEYRVIAKIHNYAGTAAGYYVGLNGDPSTANYAAYRMYGSGTTVVSDHQASPGMFIGETMAAGDSFSEMVLYAKSGTGRYAVTNTNGYNATYIFTVASFWNNTTSNVTSMVFNGAIGAGSHFEIWAKR